jgi:hypothetical protein
MKSLFMMLLLTFSGMLFANTVATNVANEETEMINDVDVGVCDVEFVINSEVVFSVEGLSINCNSVLVADIEKANSLGFIYPTCPDLCGDRNIKLKNNTSKEFATHSFKSDRDRLSC